MTQPDNLLELPLHAGAQIPTRDARDWVTSVEITQEAGITYRQLDYWTRTGLIAPIEAPRPGSGYLRRYTEDELVKTRTIRELLDAGIALVTIREHLDEVLTVGHFDHGPVRITVHHEPDQETA